MGAKQCIIYTLLRCTVNIRRGISIVRDVVYYKRSCAYCWGSPSEHCDSRSWDAVEIPVKRSCLDRV